MAVQSAPFQTEQCTIHFYKASETSSGAIEEDGQQTCPVLGQHAPNCEIPDSGHSTFSHSISAVEIPGIHSQYRQVCSIPNTADRVFRFQHKLMHDDTISSNDEVYISSKLCKTHDASKGGHSKRVISIAGNNGSSTPSRPPSPLHCRQMERMKSSYLRQGNPFDYRLPVNHAIKEDISW